MFLVRSPIVIYVPTRGLLAVEIMHAIVQWLANLNIKRIMTSMFVNKKHFYLLESHLLTHLLHLSPITGNSSFTFRSQNTVFLPHI